MVKIKHLGLANIISDKEPIKEFIQYNTRATDIARETIRILDDAEYRQEMIQALKTVSEMLGKSGGINNMAELILEMLC